MDNFDSKIIELCKNTNLNTCAGLEKLERLIEDRLKQEPKNVRLWIKLSLVEQAVPLCDTPKSIQCLENVLAIEPENAIALLLLAYVYHYDFSGIDETLMNRLNLLHTGDNAMDSMLKYAVSWYYQSLKYTASKPYQSNNATDLEEKYLKDSIEVYSEHVWNYVHLARLLISKSIIPEAKELIKKALGNVKKIYTDTIHVIDITDVKEFLNERIKGIYITDTNLEDIQALLNQ
jgi:hypothetical protein